MRRRSMRSATGLLLLLGMLASCAPTPRAGSLPPTLTMEERPGGAIAFQNGIAVPTFDAQRRPQITLDGTWRVQRQQLDNDLTLTDRDEVLDDIVAEAAGRERADFDDEGWEEVVVPGALNHPPDEPETGAWYRRSFFVPSGWHGTVATLKAGSMNYVADLWLNGSYLGYHEGGYTPFAFDLSGALRPGAANTLAVRVDNPAWGTRNDIVPWGLADWWNYGGITRALWIEQAPATHLVRADVVPHLDGLDVGVVVTRTSILAGMAPEPDDRTASPSIAPVPSASAAASASPDAANEAPQPDLLRVEVLPAEVTSVNLVNPDASALVKEDAEPIVVDEIPLRGSQDGAVRLETGFLLGGADQWSPARPALFVLRASLVRRGGPGDATRDLGARDGFISDTERAGVVTDELWTSFGLRHVAVDPEAPRVLLNGEPTMLTGVALHDEVIEPGATEESTTAHRVTDASELLVQLEHARAVDAELIRSGHTPANPLLLMLADRLGFAIWEEIPLYHYTPLTYGIAMDRGIPQQMLREMALRDMNRPSVLFHGLSNESTGTNERASALEQLHEIDRRIDGTRLTGQAAYASTPDDPTHAPLDVAGFTFYYGVFYGTDAAADTARALEVVHATHPDKPVLALEFGRWADTSQDAERQRRIFDQTFPQFRRHSAEREDGFVAGTVWWTLEDYMTAVPRIIQEHFGLYDSAGEPRPAAASAVSLYAAVAGEGADQMITSDVRHAEVTARVGEPDYRLFGYLAYGLALSVGAMSIILLVLLRRGGRAIGRAR